MIIPLEEGLSTREPLGRGPREQRQRTSAHGRLGQRFDEQRAVTLGQQPLVEDGHDARVGVGADSPTKTGPPGELFDVLLCYGLDMWIFEKPAQAEH